MTSEPEEEVTFRDMGSEIVHVVKHTWYAPVMVFVTLLWGLLFVGSFQTRLIIFFNSMVALATFGQGVIGGIVHRRTPIGGPKKAVVCLDKQEAGTTES